MLRLASDPVEEIFRLYFHFYEEVGDSVVSGPAIGRSIARVRAPRRGRGPSGQLLGGGRGSGGQLDLEGEQWKGQAEQKVLESHYE